MTKTVIFEEKFKTEINNFSSTEQVTKFLEDKLKKRLNIISLNQNLVSHRGNIFPITQYNMDEKLDEAIKLNSKKAVKLSKRLENIR